MAIQYALNNNGAANSLTTSFGATAGTGDMLVCVVDHDPALTITSVVTVGGSGSDTLSLLATGGTGINIGAYDVYFVSSCGAGRTGITVTLTGTASFIELAIWDAPAATTGLSNPVSDTIFRQPSSGITNTANISGTTPTLGAAVEFAIIWGACRMSTTSLEVHSPPAHGPMTAPAHSRARR